MDNSQNIRTSLTVFGLVFAVVLVFKYFYEKMKNKDDLTYRFDWRREILISLAFASGAALISSIFFMCKKESSLDLGMRKNKMRGCGCGPNQMMRYRMSCE